jgi:hypothetical protein
MNCPKLLDTLQRETFAYFVHEANPLNGLVIDKTDSGSPASIAAVGLGLSCYPVGVERGFMSRAAAVERTLATLRFFHRSVQSNAPDATGYKGFYYHFLDMKSGKRAWKSELSTIDSAFLLAGMLTAAAYFLDDTKEEREIRALADELYARADWNWAANNGPTVTLGWKPESGFLPDRWSGYNEALFLYVLALGSPTHPLPQESYQAWMSSYQWRESLGQTFLQCGPLFTHQISHIWLDLRDVRDDFMRNKNTDYFENSRRATYAQRQYAIENPHGFECYGEHCWGITATDGPGPATRMINGKKRRFFGYVARGVPDGPDDGSIAPWATAASLPFAPEIVEPALEYFESLKLRERNPYGFKATFNPTFACKADRTEPWVSPFHFGVDQGPVVLMIENHRSGLLWRLMRENPYVITGLQRAGFTGGWLGTISGSPTGQGSQKSHDH